MWRERVRGGRGRNPPRHGAVAGIPRNVLFAVPDDKWSGSAKPPRGVRILVDRRFGGEFVAGSRKSSREHSDNVRARLEPERIDRAGGRPVEGAEQRPRREGGC